MNTQETQNLYKWGYIVLIILAVFLGAQTLNALKGLGQTSPSYNSISVSGEGEVFAVPDIATFSFTVSADASSVSAAQEEVTQKMDVIIEALKAQGIEEKDIKTADYSAYPRYSYTQGVCTQFSCPPSRQVLEGYTVNHNVSVKVRNTDNAGQALAAAGENGATGLSGISFTVDDADRLTDDARAMAIEDAREKAEFLADELDVRLVRVVSFHDSTDGGYPIPYYAREGMGGDTAVALEARAPTLPTGENKVRVIVNVVYEIK